MKIQSRMCYGRVLHFPMCDASKKLASLKFSKNPTFTEEDLRKLKEIGIVFEQIPQYA